MERCILRVCVALIASIVICSKVIGSAVPNRQCSNKQ
jgi:hypothetical protein